MTTTYEHTTPRTVPGQDAWSVIDSAWGISADDERVTLRADGPTVELTDTMLANLLTTSELVYTRVSGDAVEVYLQRPVDFDEGDGWVDLLVVADADTHAIDSLSVSARLYDADTGSARAGDEFIPINLS